MHLSEETRAWLTEPHECGPLFELIKLFAEISRIATAINAIDFSDQAACQSLLNDCLALETNHMKLYLQVDQNIDGEPPTYARGEINTGIPPTDDLFGPPYRFSSLNDAILHNLIWLSLSFVYPLIGQCQTLVMADTLNGFRIDHCSIEDEPHRLSIFYAGKAARCLPYCAQEGMNSWGISYGVVTAVQASRVFTHARDWDRFLWARDVFTFIELSGFDNAARFRDIWWSYWFETDKHDAYRLLNYRKLDNEHKASLHRVTEGNASNAAIYPGIDGLTR